MSTREAAPVDRGVEPADLGTERLDLGYGGTPVVRSLDLRLPPGRVTAIVGPNGCGKSTLLGALARVHGPQGGAVLLDGRDLASLRPRDAARRIGLLPQQAEAPDGLTVRDLVRYGRHPHQGLLRQWSPADAAAVHRALAAADLLDLADRPLDTLSGGQRQRAWIAMVVAQETAVVLLDEPTSALDLGHQLEVLDLVHGLAAEGRTVVLVLHDLSTACRHADHLVAMRAGRVVAEGAPAAVVTPALVRDLYGVEAVVLRDPTAGTPVVCPVRRVEERQGADRLAAGDRGQGSTHGDTHTRPADRPRPGPGLHGDERVLRHR